MSPHEQAEEFVSHYLSIMSNDSDVNNFHKVLEMKVSTCTGTYLMYM